MESTDLPISKLMAFPGMVIEKQKHLDYENRTKLENPIPILQPKALLGIEIEVENLRNYIPIEYYWKIKEDGSLRNNGRELVSIPLRGYQVEYALDHAYTALHEANEPDFSPRTSVHIHLNVRDMTWDQIKTLVLLYAIFERHFFNQVGTKRETSVFCVPLYKTNQLTQINNFGVTKTLWHKYNAINCSTICGTDNTNTYGTIEFRHMYGTINKKIIIDWINQILCLRQACITIPYQELLQMLVDMNTTSTYVALYVKVFGQWAKPRQMEKLDYEYCVTTTKKALWGNKLNNTKEYSYKITSALGKLISQQTKKNTSFKNPYIKTHTGTTDDALDALFEQYTATAFIVKNVTPTIVTPITNL